MTAIAIGAIMGLLSFLGLGKPDPEMCLRKQPGVSAGQRVEVCTKLIDAERDPASLSGFHNGRGSAYRELGDSAAAKADYDRGVALNPDNAIVLRNRGVLAYEEDDYDAAIADFSRAIALKPDYADAYEDRSDAYYLQRRYNEALEDIERALELEAPTVDRLYDKGLILVQIARYRDAIPILSQAIGMDPDHAKSIERRSTAYSMLGERDAALKDTRRLLELRPGDADGYASLCGHHMMSDPDFALAQCDKALSIDPERAATWDNRATLMEMKGDMASARVNRDRAVELWPYEPTFRANRAIALIRDGAFDRAQADVDVGLAEDPAFDSLLTAGAQLALIRGERPNAEAMLSRVLAADENEPAALSGLGWLRLVEERPADARALFDRVLATEFGPRREIMGRRLRWTALYGRGVARLRQADAGGEDDLKAARALQTDVDEIVARWGEGFARTTPPATP